MCQQILRIESKPTQVAFSLLQQICRWCHGRLRRILPKLATKKASDAWCHRWRKEWDEVNHFFCAGAIVRHASYVHAMAFRSKLAFEFDNVFQAYLFHYFSNYSFPPEQNIFKRSERMLQHDTSRWNADIYIRHSLSLLVYSKVVDSGEDGWAAIWALLKFCCPHLPSSIIAETYSQENI